MNDVVTYTEVAEWAESKYPESRIRVWSDGDVEVSIDNTDMRNNTSYKLTTEELPGDWCIDEMYFSKHGVSAVFTRSINLDRGEER